MTYSLGAVRPFVADVANTVGPRLGITVIYGWRATAGDMAGHPAGRALDITVGSDVAKGNTVAAYFIANAGPLLVDYLAWQQRKWKPGVGWTPMAAKGGEKPGYDPNHRRHVHVSFTSAVDDGRRLGAPVVPKGPGGLPFFKAPPADATDENWVEGFFGGIGDFFGATADAVGGVVEGVADAVMAVPRALGILFSIDTWKRVAQVLGGVLFIVGGVAILSKSSSADTITEAGTAAATGGAKGGTKGRTIASAVGLVATT